MSKSILVIDTLESCCGCDLVNGHYCGKQKRYIGEEEFETVPGWCPLRYLPEKYRPVSMNFERGFNACIDEILKGVDTE